jgi:hypothetical protein
MIPSDWHTMGDLMVALYRAFVPRHGRELACIGAAYVIQICNEPCVSSA